MHIFEKYTKPLSYRLVPWYKLFQIIHFFSSIVSLRRRKFLEMDNQNQDLMWVLETT